MGSEKSQNNFLYHDDCLGLRLVSGRHLPFISVNPFASLSYCLLHEFYILLVNASAKSEQGVPWYPFGVHRCFYHLSCQIKYLLLFIGWKFL